MRSSVLLAAVPLAALACPAAAPAQTGAKIYKQVVPAVVWVHSTRPQGLATGTGTLVDKERRLILTNFHVVGDNPIARVFFPAFQDGKPISERDYYLARSNQLGITGRVIVMDRKTDLALIRLDAPVGNVEAVRLAAASPDTGSETHTIGNAGASDALFGYVKGTVRGVYNKRWQAELEPRRVAQFEARVVETDSPTNPGDSGGPLLNDRGELIGVTQGGHAKAQLVSTFIDISEVKKLMGLPQNAAPMLPNVNAPMNEVVPRDNPVEARPTPALTAPTSTPPATPPTSSRTPIIVGGVVLGLLVIAGMVVGVLYVMKAEAKKKKVKRRRLRDDD